MSKGRPKLPPYAKGPKPIRLQPIGKQLDEAQRRWSQDQKRMARHEQQQQKGKEKG